MHRPSCPTVGFLKHLALLFCVYGQLSVASDNAGINRTEDEVITTAGHFVYGFEFSSFIPCNASALGLKSNIRLQAVGIWVWLPSELSGTLKPNVRYYIEATGVLRGPGHFGHLGSAPYELRIDDLLTVRNSLDTNCVSK